MRDLFLSGLHLKVAPWGCAAKMPKPERMNRV